MKNFNLKKYLAENKLLKEEYSIPSQEEVDKFFTDTQNEIHYLASKPVMGQKGDRVRSEIEPWDEYDLSNWNALVRKAKLSEDRKAKEYIKSISDPEEREAERKRMFGDDELDEATDFNDPALIAARAAQMKRDKIEADEKDKQSYLNKKYGSSFMDKLEAEIDLKNELADLEDEREDVLRNMEEEAEPEGGEIADDYGSILNNMDAKIAAIKSDLDDLRMYESVKEITTSPVSGTKAGVIYSLDNRKYVLTNDVKGARIGDYTNITLPKGTVMYNLPGGLMADHESLRQYAKLSGNIYFDKPTYAGVGIRRMPDILTAIENNSNVIEESLNEDLIKEITLDGGNYQDSYGNNPADDQITTTEDYEIFMEMFPRGEASRILMDPKRKELYDKHLEWTKDYDGNFTFEHMQYHLVKHDGEEYKVHQSQYYNGNYKDFRNPRFTELTISKDGKRMGTYLVDTGEYIKDLEDLDVQKRVTESLNEEFKVGDKVTYLGHPAVVTATKEYNGRDFVSVSYDKGNGATKAPMILVKSGDVKAVNELELDVTDSGNPETLGDEAIERESASPAFESKLTTIYKSIKK